MYAGLLLTFLALGGGQEPKVVEPIYEFKLIKENSIVAAKMRRLASALGAKVMGDEGELY